MTFSRAHPPLLRLASVLVFVGLPALCLALGVTNLLQAAEDRDRLGQSALQAAALEQRIGRPVSGAATPDQALFLAAGSRTAAMAGLQQALLDAIAQAGGRVLETAAADEVAAEGADAGRVTVRTTLDIDNDGLLTLLYRVESRLPLMDVASLSIRRLPGAGGAAGEGAGTGADGGTQPIMLRVDLSVSARWKPAGEAAP
ncbi:hypothetical protein BTR14_09925 [Rhizobium rhizosphaerae]|uniref:General secretion pathway protein M n=1 Tax=Xaviernesmea rhizosphaerae TaxID=1672749 RepID=A0ABX3PEP9_9HYPH|nr:type II secretion system protein GspM [Xaviernesmea rhizosphaerae]OQP86744.1 hypothetical protein BTR14_09925 [Xaviernesmea rhizosphaerae]